MLIKSIYYKKVFFFFCRFRLDTLLLYETAARAYLNTRDAEALIKLIRSLLNKHVNDISPEKFDRLSEQVVSLLVNEIVNLIPE